MLNRNAWILTLCTVFGAASSAIGTPVLDQQSGPYTPSTYLVMADVNLPNGTTFTSSLSGTLVRVDASLHVHPSVTEPIIAQIYPVTGSGMPNLSAAPLGFAALAPSQVPVGISQNAFVSFDFTASNVIVSPGQKLAFMLSTNQPYPFLGAPAYVLAASRDGQGTYFGGEYWYRNSLSGQMTTLVPNTDMTFRTYVVPEPTAIALALGCLACLVATRRRRACPALPAQIRALQPGSPDFSAAGGS